jgi:hypothetical protein
VSPPALHVTLDGDTRTIRCDVYCGADVRVDAGYDDAAAWGQFDHNAALLVRAAPRAIQVPEVNADNLGVTAEMGQRQPKPLVEEGP